MKKQTAEVFHALMKKGWIDRSESQEIWRSFQDADVKEELETMKSVLGFELIPVGDRVYLVPTQENDLFLKNNSDFRRDIGASDTRSRDLYLMSYLSLYLIYMFYHGEGTDPKCREFISKEDAIREFSEHCRACIQSGSDGGEQTDYSADFVQLANMWLSKLEGSPDDRSVGLKYGMLNRILTKYSRDKDDLFYEEAGNIRPTRKLDDLMPYFLRKDRIAEIQGWVSEVNENAANI